MRGAGAVFLGRVLTLLVCCAALAACDQDQTVTEQRVKIYPSLAACEAEQSVADCTAAFQGAQQQQLATAPQYNTLQACEDRYGPAACMPYQSATGSWFIPAMVGFMVGHALGGAVYQPVYVDRGGWAYSGGEILGTYRRGCAPGQTGPGCNSGVGVGSSYVYNAGSSGGSGSHAIWTSSAYRSETVTTHVARGGFGSGSSIGGKSVSGGDRVGVGTGSISRGGFGGTASAMSARGGGG